MTDGHSFPDKDHSRQSVCTIVSLSTAIITFIIAEKSSFSSFSALGSSVITATLSGLICDH